jgi:hypothetical protein
MNDGKLYTPEQQRRIDFADQLTDSVEAFVAANKQQLNALTLVHGLSVPLIERIDKIMTDIEIGCTKDSFDQETKEHMMKVRRTLSQQRISIQRQIDFCLNEGVKPLAPL